MGIASSVPWARYNMKVIGEAADGESAWSLYEAYRPDLVITDIRMPKMDGLELMRRIHAVNPACRVIVVTNVEYDETYEKAKEFGAAAFLLKATLNRDDLEKAVWRIRSTWSDQDAQGEEKPGVSPLLADYFSAPDKNYDAYCRKCRSAGISAIVPHGFILMRICTEESTALRLQESLSSLIQHGFMDQKALHVIFKGKDTLFVFSREMEKEALLQSLKNMRRYLSDHFGTEVRFAVLADRALPESMPALAAKAEGYLDQEPYFDEGILSLGISGIPHEADFIQAANTLKYYLFSGPEGRDGLMKIVQDIESLPVAVTQGWQTFRAAIQDVLRRLNGQGWEEESRLDAAVNHLTAAVNLYLEGFTRQRRPELTETIVYIQHHLGEDLSLPRLCQMIGFHPAYFSTLFKKETGIGYSAYVTNARIWEAQNLLRSTSLPLQQISDLCGFSDVSYFSHKFKSVTGLAPSQWRNKL